MHVALDEMTDVCPSLWFIMQVTGCFWLSYPCFVQAGCDLLRYVSKQLHLRSCLPVGFHPYLVKLPNLKTQGFGRYSLSLFVWRQDIIQEKPYPVTLTLEASSQQKLRWVSNKPHRSTYLQMYSTYIHMWETYLGEGLCHMYYHFHVSSASTSLNLGFINHFTKIDVKKSDHGFWKAN